MKYIRRADITEEHIDSWVEAYENGDSISAISAKEAARGSSLGFHTIRRALASRGVKLRTRAEALRLMTRNFSWKR